MKVLDGSLESLKMLSAVVTGSSSGIGLATATALVQRGYSVVLHGHRNLSGLQSAASRLSQQLAKGAELHCITADLSCEQSCRRLVQACFQRHPGLDLWFNNAGADVLTGDLRSVSFEQKLDRLWQVDVLGTIRLSRLVAERMADRSERDLRLPTMEQAETVGDSAASPSRTPSIVNMGWDQALLGMEGESGQLFCAAKAAVIAFTSAFSLTVAPIIRVNAVSPGWIRTAWGEQSTDEFWNRRAISESQLARWGTPEDVAQVVCWLASPESAFVNGQNISVNGGRRFFCTASPGKGTAHVVPKLTRQYPQ